MTTEQFMILAQNRMQHCVTLMAGSKDADYTRNGDKFHNFKRAAQIANITPEQALKGMWLKHIVSIFDIIDDIDQGKLPTQEIINDKFTDMINYPALLEGLITERRSSWEISK